MDWVIFLCLIILSECKAFHLFYKEWNTDIKRKNWKAVFHCIMIPSIHSLTTAGELDYVTHIPCVYYAQRSILPWRKRHVLWRNIDVYGMAYSYGALPDTTWTSAIICFCGPQLYFRLDLVPMNVGLNLADMVRQLVVLSVTHLHQNQVSLLTTHSTDSHTDTYIQIISIRPRVCVYMHTLKHQY